jgi:hypothetical protein
MSRRIPLYPTSFTAAQSGHSGQELNSGNGERRAVKEIGIVGQREEEVGGGPGGRRPYGSAHRAAEDGGGNGGEEVLKDLEGQVDDGAEVRAASSLPAHLCTKECIVADPGCLSRIRIFFQPDPIFFHPRSQFFLSRIRIKEFKYFNPTKWFLRFREYDPGCSSRIRILIFFIYPGSRGQHRIPDLEPQH